MSAIISVDGPVSKTKDVSLAGLVRFCAVTVNKDTNKADMKLTRYLFMVDSEAAKGGMSVFKKGIRILRLIFSFLLCIEV